MTESRYVVSNDGSCYFWLGILAERTDVSGGRDRITIVEGEGTGKFFAK